MNTTTITGSGTINTLVFEKNTPDNSIKRGGFYLHKGDLYICGHTTDEHYHMTSLSSGETYSSSPEKKEYYTDRVFDRYLGPITVNPKKLG